MGVRAYHECSHYPQELDWYGTAFAAGRRDSYERQWRPTKYSHGYPNRPTTKWCGHTHAAFPVPSVAAAKSFLEAQGMSISGERVFGGIVKSVFVRDLDLTTWEFERNVGDSQVANFGVSMIGDEQRRIDHVGTRVSDPPRSWQWYATMFGFTEEVLHYEHNPIEPLKNFRPWICRTQETGIDMNLLINANQPPTDDKKNILMADGGLKPGIIYVGFEVADVQASQQALKTAGASVFTEDGVVSLGLKKDKLPTLEGSSTFVADPDWNLFRLVQQ